MVLLALIALLTTAPVAQAVEPSITEDGSGGYNVLYPNGKKLHLNSEAARAVQNAINSAGLTAGFTGQSAKSVIGNEPGVELGEKIGKEVTSDGLGEEYGARSTSFDEELEAFMEGEGTAPSLAEVFEASPALVVTLGAGAFAVGYGIGSLINGWLELEGRGGEEGETQQGGCNCGSVQLNGYKDEFKVSYSANDSERETLKSQTDEFTIPAGGIAYYSHTGGVDLPKEAWAFSSSVIGESEFNKEGDCGSAPSPENDVFPSGGFLTKPLIESFFYCGAESSHPGWRATVVGATLGKTGLLKAFGRGVQNHGWPSKSVSTEGVDAAGKELAVPGSLSSPPAMPNLVSEVAPKVTTYVITKYVDAGGTGTEGEPQNPLAAPELPAPRPNEVGTEYKSELETDGWTHVEVRTLPESDEDAQIGPEVVAYTDPAAGSYVQYSSEVVVEQNPADAPAPGGPGITLPALPSIKLPEVPDPCRLFPFGVPCWFGEQIESWSVSSRAPDWTWRLPFGISWHFEGGVAESFMEVVRPAEAILTAIGVILMLGRFASSSSGGGDGGGGGDD